LNQTTLHQEILGGDVLLERTLSNPANGGKFLAALQGMAIAQWYRRGKYLLAALEPAEQLMAGNVAPVADDMTGTALATLCPAGGWLGVHLRMTGQLLYLSQDISPQKHCRVRLFFPQQRELRFVDQRTFGQMWWVPLGTAPAQIITGLAQLGPEPFSEAFSIPYLKRWLQGRQRPIKNALLDQSLVAGVGNIYADEALFLSGIHPLTLCASLPPRPIKQLHSAVVRVLQEAIAARGTTFSSFQDVEGINGNYGGMAWVYGRQGQPCRTCDTPIERIKLAGRSAHFCPRCQRRRRSRKRKAGTARV
jgi:formamidopyrimidine-DNA glycosylase